MIFFVTAHSRALAIVISRDLNSELLQTTVAQFGAVSVCLGGCPIKGLRLELRFIWAFVGEKERECKKTHDENFSATQKRGEENSEHPLQSEKWRG